MGDLGFQRGPLIYLEEAAKAPADAWPRSGWPCWLAARWSSRQRAGRKCYQRA